MKRLFCLILCAALLTSLFSGCASTAPAETTLSVTTAPTATESPILQIESPTVPETAPLSETIPQDTPIPAFTGLSDPNLLTYVEDSVASQLAVELKDSSCSIEEVEASYLSAEYLHELEYNSQSNIYFGYTPEELDAMFQESPYYFTLGEDGTTVVKEIKTFSGQDLTAMVTDVAAESGIILLRVAFKLTTKSNKVITVVNLIWSVAKDAFTEASMSAAKVSALTFVEQAYETGDYETAFHDAALAGGEEFQMKFLSGIIK